MRWLLVVTGIVVGAAVVVLVIGAALPVAHVAAVRVQLGAPPDSVFAAISQPATAPEWRSDLESVEILSQPGERVRWRETTSGGPIRLAAEEVQPPVRFVTLIDDPGLPFGGRWIHEIEPDRGGTLVTITEEGEVYNPLFRFVSRFILGHYATLERYGGDLASHFGSEGGVQRVTPDQ